MSQNARRLVGDLIRALELLQSKSVGLPHHQQEQVLQAFYRVGVHRVPLSPNDRSVIAQLVKPLVEDLLDCVINMNVNFDRNRGLENFILRSGLQFLLDDYRSIPVSDSSSELLASSLKLIEESTSLKELDQEFLDWMEDPSAPGECDLTYDPADYARPSDVPGTHTWWFKVPSTS